MGLLVACGELSAEIVEKTGFVGELGLDGTLRPVSGVVSLVDAIGNSGANRVIAALDNARQAVLTGARAARGARTLGELVGALRGNRGWTPFNCEAPTGPTAERPPDLADVKGQI